MRKFKLLKDLPDCPKGTIGVGSFMGTIVWKKGVFYNVDFILSHKDWFEEVVEGTMCKYEPICCVRGWDCKDCGNYPKPAPKKIELFYAGEFCAKNELDNKVNLMNKINELIKAINEMRGAV